MLSKRLQRSRSIYKSEFSRIASVERAEGLLESEQPFGKTFKEKRDATRKVIKDTFKEECDATRKVIKDVSRKWDNLMILFS